MALAKLDRLGRSHPAHTDFWSELVPGYEAFEATGKPPRITVDRNGRYVVERVP